MRWHHAMMPKLMDRELSYTFCNFNFLGNYPGPSKANWLGLPVGHCSLIKNIKWFGDSFNFIKLNYLKHENTFLNCYFQSSVLKGYLACIACTYSLVKKMSETQ